MRSLTIFWSVLGGALYALIALGWYIKLTRTPARNKLVAIWRFGLALLWLPVFALLWFAGWFS